MKVFRRWTSDDELYIRWIFSRGWSWTLNGAESQSSVDLITDNIIAYRERRFVSHHRPYRSLGMDCVHVRIFVD
jgi:hypothetical protein